MKAAPGEKLYRVYYNTHEYEDTSDPPRSAKRLMSAPTGNLAREKVRALRKAGERWIGMIHQAYPIIDGVEQNQEEAEE